MNDIYEISFVLICFGAVVLFAYFGDKRGQRF